MLHSKTNSTIREKKKSPGLDSNGRICISAPWTAPVTFHCSKVTNSVLFKRFFGTILMCQTLCVEGKWLSSQFHQYYSALRAYFVFSIPNPDPTKQVEMLIFFKKHLSLKKLFSCQKEDDSPHNQLCDIQCLTIDLTTAKSALSQIQRPNTLDPKRS